MADEKEKKISGKGVDKDVEKEITYKDFIDNILNTRGRFACGSEYHERHHIIPKCLGGSNKKDNLIDLFAREHFEAHRLLAKENSENRKLLFAWTCMAFVRRKDTGRYLCTAEEYEEVRKMLSSSLKGIAPKCASLPKTEETRKRMSEAQKKREYRPPRGEKSPFYGRKRPAEVLKKMSEGTKKRNLVGSKNPMYGRPWWDENTPKEKIEKWHEHKKGIQAGEKNPFYGKKHSDETKHKISGKTSKKVYCIEDKKMYKSVREAAKERNIHEVTLSKACVNHTICNEKHYIYVYDTKRRNGDLVLGAISLGYVNKEEICLIEKEK